MPSLSRSFRALSLSASVEVDPGLPREIHDGVDALVATYPPASHPVHRYELRADPLVVFRDGRPGALAEHPDDLLIQLEIEILHDVTETAPSGWFLHAAAVSRQERAIVLVGPSGAGKSTLACGLVSRGARYLTDEMALLTDSSICGLRRPIGFDGPFVGALPQGFAEHLRTDGRSRLVIPPASALATEVVGVDAIVDLLHDPSAPTLLRRRSAREALEPLWHETRRCDGDGLALAVETLSRVPAYHLRSRNLEEACAAVESLFSSTSGTAP